MWLNPGQGGLADMQDEFPQIDLEATAGTKTLLEGTI